MSKERDYVLKLEVQIPGYGLEVHEAAFAERVLRELETKFGYENVTVYRLIERRTFGSRFLRTVRKRVYRTDRNAPDKAATDAGTGN